MDKDKNIPSINLICWKCNESKGSTGLVNNNLQVQGQQHGKSLPVPNKKFTKYKLGELIKFLTKLQIH